MTKIMFVDDDAIIRRNIANKIDWKGHGGNWYIQPVIRWKHWII